MESVWWEELMLWRTEDYNQDSLLYALPDDLLVNIFAFIDRPSLITLHLVRIPAVQHNTRTRASARWRVQIHILTSQATVRCASTSTPWPETASSGAISTGCTLVGEYPRCVCVQRCAARRDTM